MTGKSAYDHQNDAPAGPSKSHKSGRAGPAAWPIRPACFLALIDLGLTEQEIARYFRIDSEEVSRFRSRCNR